MQKIEFEARSAQIKIGHQQQMARPALAESCQNCAGLTRRGRSILMAVIAVHRSAFPGLNLAYVVNLGNVKGGSA